MLKNAYDKTTDLLDGRKTYLVAAILVLFGLLGVYLGEISAMDAARTILEGVGLATLRVAFAKKTIDQA